MERIKIGTYIATYRYFIMSLIRRISVKDISKQTIWLFEIPSLKILFSSRLESSRLNEMSLMMYVTVIS